MVKKSFPIYLWAVLAMLGGIWVGVAFGREAESLGEISKYIIGIFKWLAIPLIFTTILETILTTKLHGRGFAHLAVACLTNTFAAVTIAIILANTLQLGHLLPIPSAIQQKAMSQSSWLTGFSRGLESNPKVSFLNSTTSSILLGIFLGILFTFLRYPFPKVVVSITRISSRFLEWLFIIVQWLVLLIPIAVFASVAKAVALSGLSVFEGLLAYFVLCLLGMLSQVFLVYQSWIHFFARLPLKKFWGSAKEVAVYSFGINSSLGTLPITLRALKNLGVSDRSARLSACIGTNFNNDGILLYEVVAALFLIQAFGIHLPLPQQFLVAGIAVLAGLGVGGIPEAGIISLTLVLSAIGLPTEILGMLISVDWFLGRCRSVTNVLGDMTCAIAVDSMEKKHTTI